MAFSSSSSHSTSPSSVSQSWNYDVFLSFKGEDTRMTFVDHLYLALVQQGIRTYLFDRQTLLRGKAIAPSIFKAIEESQVAVIVLSKNYAESSFCLNELSHIMKCKDERGQIVMPIFYHVDPFEVRYQKQEYGEALAKHESRNKNVESWRKALMDVGCLSGWETKHMANGYEAQQIQVIVDAISNQLFPNKYRVEMGTDHLKVPLQDILLASSSSSSSSQSQNHDVFVSFKGEDTRKTFVDHLYSALAQKRIYTYQDEDPFPRLGKAVTRTLLKAIEESRIAVIVLSKHYVDSPRCLNELAYIMKCKNERGQIVMPIFYHIDPSQVINQNRRYVEALAEHEPEKEDVEYWREALAEVRNLSGFIAKGHEAKLVKEIVDAISYELFSNKDQVEMGTSHLKIPLQDILLATNKFAEANIIATTGFGKVYKGKSARHGIVAIKQLDRVRGQGDREFTMEIALLSICKHENIASLVGFCDEGGEKILVYRYEKNGSLDRLLRSKDLTWMRRLRICLGAAFGLKYLHDDVGPQHRVLHRDVKSANILLDENWKPKISDFGLSKIALANVPLSALVSDPCGTPGYIDPQYIGQSTLTQKSDVYSFGVVMFEVLFGRAVTVAEHPDENHFSVKMAKSHYEEKTLEEMIDGDLRNQMKSASLRTFSTIAYECLKEHGEERPRMIQVIEQLVKALDYQQDVGAA